MNSLVSLVCAASARVIVFAWCLLVVPAFVRADSPEGKTDPAEGVRDRLKAWTAQSENLKQGVPTPEVGTRIALLEVAIDAAERHLQAIELRKSGEARLKAIEKQSAEWNGPPGKPPYSWLLADRYRGTLISSQEAILVAEGFQKVVAASVTEISNRMLEEDAAVRRAREALEKAPDDAARADARARLDDATLRLNSAAEEKAAAEVELGSIEISLKVERVRSALANRQLEMISSPLVFTDAELKSALAELETIRARLTAERQKLSRTQRASISLRVAEAGLTTRGDVIGWQLALVDLRRELLETRQRWINNQNADGAAADKERLGELFTRPEMWRALFDSRQRVLRAAIKDQEDAPKPATEADTAYLEELKAIDREFQIAIEEAGDVGLQRRVWMPQVDDAEKTSGFSAWTKRATKKVSDTLRGLWEFEIYTVEDMVKLEDGRSVPAKRSITLGKLLFLVGIVTAGYFILRALASRLAERMRVRLHLDPAKAQTVRRWFIILGMSLLGLYALHYARIPLTAFAFLGGALAIGVGFGTQNLIRNFISGLLIQAEKPIKVGDVVDVGGIQGTVSTIGMRSSIIRHWDGIETVIPNSELLENNVTNWTHTDHMLRSTVRMGVDYGTDPDKISRLLVEVATANNEVLASPEPFVLFEDFAESSLIFSLYFWIDMRKSGRTQVASQLRHAIVRVFEEQSISMAYPQRDMHLSAKEPLHVRVSRQE
ncbi:MAG: mechanosensitive ion channel family protein [Verrucomicrobiales bacterium]